MYIKVWSSTFSSDSRKPGLVPGESLSPATIFGSVLEKLSILVSLHVRISFNSFIQVVFNKYIKTKVLNKHFHLIFCVL